MSPYDILAESYEEVFPCPPETVDYVKHHTPKDATRVLDLGCATGQLDRWLCDAGFRVDAVDDSPFMISHAVSRRQCGADNPRFHQADMMRINNLFMPSCFGHILCLGNTLVHLKDRHQVRCLLSKCRKLLAGSGSMTIQMLDYDSAPGTPEWSFPEIETSAIRFRRAYRSENGQLLFDIAVKNRTSGEEASATLPLLPLTWAQLREDAKDSGFTYFERYADYSGTPYAESGNSFLARLL